MDGFIPVLVSPQVHLEEGFGEWWWTNIKAEAWVCEKGVTICRGRGNPTEQIPQSLFLFKSKDEALLFKLAWGGHDA